LYPSEKGEGESGKGKQKEMEDSTVSDLRREEIRTSILEAMEKGELSSEPEILTLNSAPNESEGSSSKKISSKSRPKERLKDPPKAIAKGVDLEQDDFFGGDSD
jgi:hypothetical protein